MGMKWTARLRVDFEMEDWAAPNLAEARLRTSVGEFQRHLESGLIGAEKTGVKHGSAKVEIVAQGPTAW
jgi:hypothetical protein